MKIKVIYEIDKGLYQIQDPVGGLVFSSSLKVNNLAYFTVTKTVDYQLGNETFVFGDSSSGSITFTLPDAYDYNGNIFQIKKLIPPAI